MKYTNVIGRWDMIRFDYGWIHQFWLRVEYSLKIILMGQYELQIKTILMIQNNDDG